MAQPGNISLPDTGCSDGSAGQRLIERFALAVEAVDDVTQGGVAAVLEEGAATGVFREAVEDGVDVGLDVDAVGEAGDEVAAAGGGDDAASEGEDEGAAVHVLKGFRVLRDVLFEDVLQALLLYLAEAGFSDGGEYPGDRLALALLDVGVGVNHRGADLCGKLTGHGRLARCHKTYKGNNHRNLLKTG